MQFIVFLIILLLLIKFTGFGAYLGTLLPGPVFGYVIATATKIVSFVLNIIVTFFEWLKHLIS